VKRLAKSTTGLEVRERQSGGKMGGVISDQGFLIADAELPCPLHDVPSTISRLSSIPGIIEHGIFDRRATKIIVGKHDGTVSYVQ
jgi:ribose 5-phosphate isomerase